MRVALVTESFPPDVNGVAHCALRTAEHLAARGHAPLVIAPTAPARDRAAEADAAAPCPVVRVPSLPLPGYRQVRVALPGRRVAAAIAAHRADLVHLASPFVIGAHGVAGAARLGLPCVAVYQTDLGGYARAYLGIGENAAWHRLRTLHTAADRTLAPSTASAADLERHGIPRVHLWPRGVDAVRFHPAHRDAALRQELAPGGEVLVGYVGRLAPEKRVELLAGVAELPGVRLVVVGDGPSAANLRAALPSAVFLGRRTGGELASIYASLDVFAHTGPMETFCQTVQEAMASGIPVVAPAAGGPLDLVSPGRTGLLVPPDDPDALRDAVRRLATTPRLRAAYGLAGRAAVEGRSWAAVGDLLIGHYEEVLAERRSRKTTASEVAA
ncbi:glycosyltransferase family 4 protein [Streptantibioticus ferralitis]|uniref:Glycosyltransferase family 1 protein n=1 Tax=Streptantibioticus ferralitis TaxID=236510 RepID=A0ABT5YXE9_9ACTN|nr:glycosyltransferase family 1 protein [Streptantibioticus ferralitis]MDF2256266.1 glycosyltransferase family 1 protein [Streptantibioticus ferralitis]